MVTEKIKSLIRNQMHFQKLFYLIMCPHTSEVSLCYMLRIAYMLQSEGKEFLGSVLTCTEQNLSFQLQRR